MATLYVEPLLLNYASVTLFSLVKTNRLKQQPEPELLAALDRLVRGDRRALEIILTLARPRLFRFCYHLTGNLLSAEELAQDTFLKALGHIRSLKEPEKIYPWLFKVARNLFIDLTRTPEHKLTQLQDQGDEKTENFFKNLPDDTQSEGETALAVRQALSRLKPEDRTILILVDHEEYSYEEAAETLGIATAALRFRLARARKDFLKFFGERGNRNGE